MATPLYIENYQPEVKFSRGLFTKLPITVLPNVGVVAGGNASPGIVFGNQTTTTGLGIYYGSGAPTITAPQGSLYLRTDASTNVTRAYINTTGSTTWTAINTVG